MEQFEIDDLLKSFTEIAINNNHIRNFSKRYNLSESSPNFNFFGKLVFPSEKQGRIIKIDTRLEGLKRIALYKEAAKRGIDIFVKPRIRKETELFIIFEEDKMNELWISIECDKPTIMKMRSIDQMSDSFEAKFISYRIKTDYQNQFDQIEDFFKEFHIGWFGLRNVGLDQYGKIKIFDYVANISSDDRGDLYH